MLDGDIFANGGRVRRFASSPYPHGFPAFLADELALGGLSAQAPPCPVPTAISRTYHFVHEIVIVVRQGRVVLVCADRDLFCGAASAGTRCQVHGAIAGPGNEVDALVWNQGRNSVSHGGRTFRLSALMICKGRKTRTLPYGLNRRYRVRDGEVDQRWVRRQRELGLPLRDDQGVAWLTNPR